MTAPGLSPLQVVTAVLGRGGDISSWAEVEGARFVATQSGRTAIALVVEALGLAPGDEVLVPAYNCGTEVDALLASGLRLRFVDCDARGLLRPEALLASVSEGTRALYVIHPFGWPQPLNEIDEWRRAAGLRLIEDCALSLFSRYPDGAAIGSVGDVAIYSLPKSLPSGDGGLLVD